MPLDCYDDAASNQKFVSFRICGKASIIQGSDVVDKVDLTPLSIPITNYTHSQRDIIPNNTIVNPLNDIKFLCIYIIYPTSDTLTIADKEIEYTMVNSTDYFDYITNPNSVTLSWWPLKELMILSGGNDYLLIRNNKAFSVRIEIMETK
jgi:hypothetical protein